MNDGCVCCWRVFSCIDFYISFIWLSSFFFQQDLIFYLKYYTHHIWQPANKVLQIYREKICGRLGFFTIEKNRTTVMDKPGKQQLMKSQPLSIKPNYQGSGKLKGKHALITGGDSGIGRAVAIHFAREGANLALNYLSEDDDARETKRLVENEGSKCLLIPGDLTDPSFCDLLIEETLKEYGKLDILVNNAATQTVEENIADMKLETINKTFQTNIISMIYLTKKALEHIPRGGRIINTTSVTSYKGHEELIDYSSTKGAITSFTRALSAQLASKNILVNGIAPGPIWTPLIPATIGVEKEEFGTGTPLGRCGEPAEVAPAYVYLASEDASYMTGQILHINGGVIVGS